MYLIYDKRYDVRQGFESVPLADLDLFDFVRPHQGVLQTVSEANVVIVLDFEADLFRVMKDRYDPEGRDKILPLAELAAFMSGYVFQERMRVMLDRLEDEG